MRHIVAIVVCLVLAVVYGILRRGVLPGGAIPSALLAGVFIAGGFYAYRTLTKNSSTR